MAFNAYTLRWVILKKKKMIKKGFIDGKVVKVSEIEQNRG